MNWSDLYYVACVLGILFTPILVLGWAMDRWPDLFDSEARADAKYARRERVARIYEESRQMNQVRRDPSPAPRQRNGAG